MSQDNDGFLSRWARRKAEARQALTPAPAPVPEAGEVVAGEPEPAVDLSLLPALEEISAATDITGFLQKGVPDALRNAALRRMWETDVAIRDYVGPADFQWDFNTPGTITGYGELLPETDVAGMLSDIADHHLKPLLEAKAPEADDQPAPLKADADAAEPLPPAEPVTEAAPLVAEARPRRRHGGATPQ